jgi:cobalt-precorrin-5B (C1)-methyltransferase
MTAPDLPDLPELRDPDLPRTMKVRPEALRTGWTTGTCTAAAARAAVMMLSSGQAPTTVEVVLPAGTRVAFAVDSCVRSTDGSVTAVVVKDAGDDPDVTHGAHLTATVSWAKPPGLLLEGGKGVGTVTKPGLGLEVGGPAINPVPRRMIAANVAEVVDLSTRGVKVTVSVPGGEVMARKTTNRRLGIIGGISILGTTGIVRPFSTASWRASVVQAVDVMAAQGERTLVLSTGGRTEKAAVRLLPDLPEVCFVEVGDFTGAALQRAVERGLAEVVFVGMVGKLTKLASGVLMTHYTRSKVDPELLAALTASAGGDAATVDAVRGANSARHAYEMWSQAGILRACGDLLCARVAAVLEAFSEARLAAEVVMVDFEGRAVVAGTGRWAA